MNIKQPFLLRIDFNSAYSAKAISWKLIVISFLPTPKELWTFERASKLASYHRHFDNIKMAMIAS